MIDIFSPLWVNPCYWILSNHLYLKYSYLIGEGKKIRENYDPFDRGANITVDIRKFEKLIDLIQIQESLF